MFFRFASSCLRVSTDFEAELFFEVAMIQGTKVGEAFLDDIVKFKEELAPVGTTDGTGQVGVARVGIMIDDFLQLVRGAVDEDIREVVAFLAENQAFAAPHLAPRRVFEGAHPGAEAANIVEKNGVSPLPEEGLWGYFRPSGQLPDAFEQKQAFDEDRPARVQALIGVHTLFEGYFKTRPAGRPGGGRLWNGNVFRGE